MLVFVGSSKEVMLGLIVELAHLKGVYICEKGTTSMICLLSSSFYEFRFVRGYWIDDYDYDYTHVKGRGRFVVILLCVAKMSNI